MRTGLVPLDRISRAIRRFPADFMFRLTPQDVYGSIRALLATPPSKHRGIGFTADFDEPKP